MFVTWKKKEKESKSEGGWKLRGCIGTFAAQELSSGLKKYAHTSAFKDSRFKPIQQAEVPLLRCDVSLLTQFEAAADCYDWKVGLHGITIEFPDPEHNPKTSKNAPEIYSATYLPEVASEQGTPPLCLTVSVCLCLPSPCVRS
jgi:AMME syndrome candidate gene 1 protein